jgi:IS605 OrfB family transposase
MKGPRRSKKKVQKVKKKIITGKEQYKSVNITVPKKMVNKTKLDALYEIDRLHAQAVNAWIDRWYNRLEMVEKILSGTATTTMQSESINISIPTAYIQIAGNRMLDILREHYLAVQDKIASDIWKEEKLPAEYKFVYAVFARNITLFSRFINGNFFVDDVIDSWASGGNEYLQKAAECYKKLSIQEKSRIPVQIKEKFFEIRATWKKPCFTGGSIFLDYRVFSISEAENTTEFNFWVEITSKQPRNRISVPFYITGKKRDILDALFPNWLNTNRRKGLLVIRGRHIHLSIPVEKEKVEPVLPIAYIGCDVGISSPISLHDGSRFGRNLNELVKKDYDEYLRLQAIRNKIRALKERAEKRYEITKNPRVREKLQRRITEYERHLSDHRWVELRRRIKATVKTEIGRAVNLMLKELPLLNHVVIILEDLSEMDVSGAKRTKRGRFDLSVWARGELQNHIKEDLEWRGGKVVFIVPDYTSQKCSKCGYVDKGNRHGDVFRCKRCGYTDHADVNAAKNIKERFFDEEIKQLVKKYSWNKDLRREKIKGLLLQRANQAA